MKDTIFIKAINRELEWDMSLEFLMHFCSYNSDFDNGNISIFLSRGLLDETIEFIRADFGNVRLEELHNSYFTSVTFECLSEIKEIETYISKNKSSILEYNLSDKNLKISYKGTNTQESTNQADNLKKTSSNFDTIENWKFELEQVRHLLRSEFQERHYDHNYNIETRYMWLNFRDISIFGLNEYNFRGYYNPSTSQLLTLETGIGNTDEEYSTVKNRLVLKIGKPTETKEPEIDDYFKLPMRFDKWTVNEMEITLTSKIVPRADVMVYGLEIRKSA